MYNRFFSLTYISSMSREDLLIRPIKAAPLAVDSLSERRHVTLLPATVVTAADWGDGGVGGRDAVQPVTSHLRHFPAAKCAFYSLLQGSLHTAATVAHFTFWCPLPAGRGGLCVCVWAWAWVWAWACAWMGGGFLAEGPPRGLGPVT